MIKMLEDRMQYLYEKGNADVQRLDKELERTPDDVEVWFESGLARNQSGLQYLDMAFEKADVYGRTPRHGRRTRSVDRGSATGI